MNCLSIKYVNFKNHAVGDYDSIKNEIRVSRALPEINNGSKRLCLNHELSHYNNRHIDFSKLIPAKFEESFIELEAIIKTPNINLSNGETILKYSLLKEGTLKFSNPLDRKIIVKRMLKLLGIKTSKKKLKELLEVVR